MEAWKSLRRVIHHLEEEQILESESVIMIIDPGLVSLIIDDLFVDHGCCRSPESMRMADNLEIFSIIELIPSRHLVRLFVS